MTRLLKFVWVYFLFGHVFSLQAELSLPAQTFKPGIGEVRALRGIVQFSINDKDWKILKANAKIPEGTVVRTKADSSIDIYLAENGPVVRLSENSILKFESLRLSGAGSEAVIKTDLHLKAGKLYGSVRKPKEGSFYQVKTSETVAEIRGIDYGVCESGKLLVFGGTAFVRRGTNNIEVKHGEIFDPMTWTTGKWTPLARVQRSENAGLRAASILLCRKDTGIT